MLMINLACKLIERGIRVRSVHSGFILLQSGIRLKRETVISLYFGGLL
jgi:NAD(P)-dependent dehydrogenase (short-subunit alcohol dehydrogenase family)